MVKARVGVRLKEAVTGGKSHNRSADLDTLANRYHGFRKKLGGLLSAVTNHHETMKAMNQSRLQVADMVAALAKDTPLFQAAGQLPDSETSKAAVLSFASVHHTMSSKTQNYIDKYKQFVIDYVVEWDRVVATRVDRGLKNAELLRQELDHYQKKVEALRGSANQKLSKGKQLAAETQEKLSRNEAKLVQSKEQYNKFATDMCILLDEVTERSWKDLHPVLVKMAQFDATISKDEAAHLGSLYQVTDALKAIADQHKLQPTARLKELETQQVSLLSTREDGPLAIGNGEATGSVFGTSSWGSEPSTSMPPGSVAPQGMGGYPVPVAAAAAPTTLPSASAPSPLAPSPLAPSPLAPMAPSSATMTTSDILNTMRSAAPPPSLEEVNGAMHNSFSLQDTSSVPAAALTMEPLGSTSYLRSQSTASSGPIAPAPSAPPPPPPPAGMSMYGAPPPMPMASAVPLNAADPASYPRSGSFAAAPSLGGPSANPYGLNGSMHGSQHGSLHGSGSMGSLGLPSGGYSDPPSVGYGRQDPPMMHNQQPNPYAGAY